MSMASLNVTQVQQPKAKQKPSLDTLVFTYSSSQDGVDENLLILFHGFGDTHIPFVKLAKSLKLPQTATLAIRAPELIPFLLEDDPQGFQWYPTYSPLGELLPNPNPSSTLEDLTRLLVHLVEECNWSSERIHLFGFGQGGSIATELGLQWNRTHRKDLGSVITVSGPLLSYPTTSLCTTPLLIVHRPGSTGEPNEELSKMSLAALKKGYTGRVLEEKLSSANGRQGMPSSRDEWMVIMSFWAEVLSRRIAGEGIFQVI